MLDVVGRDTGTRISDVAVTIPRLRDTHRVRQLEFTVSGSSEAVDKAAQGVRQLVDRVTAPVQQIVAAIDDIAQRSAEPALPASLLWR